MNSSDSKIFQEAYKEVYMSEQPQAMRQRIQANRPKSTMTDAEFDKKYASVYKASSQYQDREGLGPRPLSGLSVGKGGFNINGKPVRTSAPAPAAKPAATTPATKPAAKVAPSAPKPFVKQTGDKAKDMATWAKANPKLASKVTPIVDPERAGTQTGTGQSAMSKQAAELRQMQAASRERQKVKPTAVKVEQVNSGLSLEGNNNSDTLHSNQYGSSLTPKDFQSLYQSIYSTTEAVEPRGGGSSPTIPGAEKFVDELPGKVKRVFKKVKKVLTREENEICEMIVEYLISENYADTEESAIEIIANMSEGWMQSIVEQSSIASRTAAVVDDQRRGSHGMAHDQKMTGDSIKKLNRYKGPRVTPGLPGA